MDIIDGLVTAAEKLGAMKEWGVISFLLILFTWHTVTARRDRKQSRKEELEKESRIDALLNTRHDQFKEVFTKAVEVIAENKGTLTQLTDQVEDMQHQVVEMDQRCERRQHR